MGKMGSASGMLWRWSVAAPVLLLLVVPVHADVTTERSSSILFFPKVLSDSTGVQTGAPVDTIIQISNTSNSLVFAHCFYINAAPNDPQRPPSVLNPPQWQEVDFDIILTKQQPTHWVVSTGRRFDPTDNTSCKVDCSNAGFDPGGLIPPVSDPFTGELKCIQVFPDGSDKPLNGNNLKGEATLVTPDGDASEYNAIGLLGLNTDQNYNNGDNTLCLGGKVNPPLCPYGPEYNGCPETVIMNHFAENAPDPAIDTLGQGPSQVVTELTVVPCSEDFENQIPAAVTIQFVMTNEFEQPFSTSTTVTCWGNFRLNSIGIGNFGRIFDVSFLGTRFVQTRMEAVATDGAGNPAPGFVAVAEEFHRAPTNVMKPLTSRAALNLHGEGQRVNADIIVIPGVLQ
jgi:hypothetical protein